jgi:hypothetical protein
MLNLNKYNIFSNLFLVVAIMSILLTNCAKKDEVTGETIVIEPNIREKAARNVEKGGGIFGNLNTKGSSNTFDFATSNVLWRATLKTIDFLPLVNADYSGGIIITDWYSEDLNSKEQIKISIHFKSSDLRTDSINIIGHKKTCGLDGNCKIQKISENFAAEIKEKIITTARLLKIEEEKKIKN